MNEYRVKVTVRNNLLLTAIEDAGYASQSDFARSAGLSPTDVNAFVAMRLAPINSHGEFRDAAKVIMEVLGASPQDLWTDKQLMLELERNTGERTVSEIAVQSILENHVQQMTLPDPEDTAFEGERSRLIDAALNSLSPREAHVIRLRFERDMTFDDVAKDIGVTRERARQIEAKALRKLRNKRHKLSEVAA